MDSNLLSNISPFIEDASVVVKIDRSFSREVVHYGANRSLKELVSVDFVMYDHMVIAYVFNFFRVYGSLCHVLRLC